MPSDEKYQRRKSCREHVQTLRLGREGYEEALDYIGLGRLEPELTELIIDLGYEENEVQAKNFKDSAAVIYTRDQGDYVDLLVESPGAEPKTVLNDAGDVGYLCYFRVEKKHYKKTVNHISNVLVGDKPRLRYRLNNGLNLQSVVYFLCAMVWLHKPNMLNVSIWGSLALLYFSGELLGTESCTSKPSFLDGNGKRRVYHSIKALEKLNPRYGVEALRDGLYISKK